MVVVVVVMCRKLERCLALLCDSYVTHRSLTSAQVIALTYQATMSQNPLDPAALTSLLPTLLPQPARVLKTPHDALACLIHTLMSALAFRLTAIDESSSSTFENNTLPVEWNKSGPSHYTFKYKHEQSSLEFVIKVSKLGGRTLMNAIALEVHKHIA